MFLSCHCAIANCDHLVDMMKNNIGNKNVDDVKMHRSKCTNIIKNILCPHFEEKLKCDISGSKHSLLLDESNDVSVTKMLGILVIYYSTNSGHVVSTYLGLVQLDQCNAESIVLALKRFLADKKLDLKNLTAIGTDNASVMVGINNGGYVKLKKDIPSLILIKCACHSLQLAVSHAAAECLPRNLEFLTAESHNWFSNSTVRQQQCCNLCKAINDGATPLKIPSKGQTRWLSIQVAVERIVNQWLELKAHFQVTRQSEKCFTSEMLFEMYNDEKNLAYLLFLHPILKSVQHVNKLFESKNIEKVKLLDELILLFETTGKRLVLRTFQGDLFNCTIEEFLYPKPYLGYQVESKIKELRAARLLSNDEEVHLRKRCQNFCLVLFKQSKQRLPENLEILRNVSLFSVQNVLQPVKDVPKYCQLMKHLGASDNSIAEAEIQLTKINLINWKQKTETELFWNKVKQFKDASGNNPFNALFECAESALILPHSNADIERVFNAMNYIKSKLRNKMKLPLLHAILAIRFGLARLGKCCSTYELPDQALKEIGTVKAYDGHSSVAQCTSGESCEADVDDDTLL